MSKKHFEAIAAIIRDERRHPKRLGCNASRCAGQTAIDDLTDRLADYFADCNDQFDWDRFVDACHE